MSEELAIDAKGMTKRFGDRTVVNDIALQVRTGEIYGFLGPNGSGKTTFIRMLCGLLRADAGSGICLGHDVITESGIIKRQVRYMERAELCHRLAYIASGSLRAHGTLKAALAEVGPTTCAVSGPASISLADGVRENTGAQQAVAFGTPLHASGEDAPTLKLAFGR